MRSLTPTMIAAAATVALLALTACADYGYPTISDAVCGVSGTGCRPDCHAVAMPTAAREPDALRYQIGPTSCPARAISEARRAARRACRDRGMALATRKAQLTEQAPVGPLPATRAAMFRCQPGTDG